MTTTPPPCRPVQRLVARGGQGGRPERGVPLRRRHLADRPSQARGGQGHRQGRRGRAGARRARRPPARAIPDAAPHRPGGVGPLRRRPRSVPPCSLPTLPLADLARCRRLVQATSRRRSPTRPPLRRYRRNGVRACAAVAALLAPTAPPLLTDFTNPPPLPRCRLIREPGAVVMSACARRATLGADSMSLLANPSSGRRRARR